MNSTPTLTTGTSPRLAEAGSPPTISIRAVLAAVIGNGLEFYDFSIYSFYAVMISRQFFPTSTPSASLLLALATFGVGFVSRPLGSIVLGTYADRVGRKPALILTLVLMALGMCLLALTPPYASIGVAAPILVVTARIIQGFALGGEVGPSSSFLLEAAPQGRRGQYGSWQRASQGASVLIAGSVGVLLSQVLPSDAMTAWGWRVPFLLGAVILPVGLYVRRQLPETLVEKTPAQAGVMATLLGCHRRALALATLLTLSTGVSTYVGNYMTTYALTTLHMNSSISLAATLVLGLVVLIVSPISGRLGDRFGRRPVLIASRLAYMIAAYPAFLFLSRYPSGPVLLLMVAVLTTFDTLSIAVGLVLIPESFPKAVRSAGMSISYAFALMISGSTTQFLVAWVIQTTGDPVSPAWFVIFAGAVGLVAMVLSHETRDIDINA
jgi:MFS family permease